MEIIDLGLPSGTKWASCNLGADSPIEFGDYYAWGDTKTKQMYVGGTCETYDINIIDLKMNDYLTGYNVLSNHYDAAARILGDGWHMPSGTQAQELVDNCTWKWETNYNGSGVNGMFGVSKINGCTIFLPAAGYKHNDTPICIGTSGGYWTSNPNMTASNRAWSIAFDSSIINVFNHGIRYNGYSIRPVTR